MIYLDHAATTPLLPEAAEAMAKAQAEAFANPSSPHAAGRRAKKWLEESRERILDLVGATAVGPSRDRLVFTSGATEANRLGILGMATAATRRPAMSSSPGMILVSPRDHASIHSAAATAGERGFQIRSLPLSAAGIPDRTLAGEADDDSGIVLATATVVCGQTGILDDPAGIARALPRSLVHADATQSIAWLETAFREAAAATMSLAPHKFGGPRGIGCLVIRHGLHIDPVVAGPQESGLRGGTEPVVLAAGFAAALAATVAGRRAEAARIAGLREDFEGRLLAAAEECGIHAVAIGADSLRAPQISTISFPGLDRQAIVMAADLEGIACSTGTACSSGSAEPAPAIAAMSLSPEIVRGAVRFSFGESSTQAEIDQSIVRMAVVLRRVSHVRSLPSAFSDRIAR